MSATTTSSAPASSPVYEFDDEVQTEIVACLMLDTDFHRRSDGLIEPTYFENEVERIFVTLAQAFFQKYKEAPSLTAWKEIIVFACKGGRIRSDLKTDAVLKLGAISKLTVRSRAWLLDKIAEFAKQQAIINAMTAGADAVFKTADPDRFDKVEKMFAGAFKVGLATNDEDYDYWERIGERTTTRKLIVAGGRPATGVTTGIPEIDALLRPHQGWGRKELSALIGGAKSSKSFHLYFFGGMAALAGHNVLIVTLENAKDIVSTRMDALMSGVGIGEEHKSPFAMEAGVVAAGAKPGVGKIRIREAPAYQFRPTDLRRMLDEYKTKGLRFDLVVLDMTDLMAPDHRVDSTIENSKSVLVGVRQIGRDDNLAVLTAFQTNREGHSAAVVKATQVSEDFNKIRTADLTLGINRTEDEKAEHKARITILAARNTADGATIFVEQDLEHGRAVAVVEKVE